MKLFRFTIILMLVNFIFFITVFGQQRDRVIKRTIWKTEPIRIVNVKVKNKIINLKEKFVESDDWLKDISIEVENISNKSIVFIEISLVFPQDESGQPESPASESLRYGAILPNVKDSEPPLQPGDRTILKLANYESLQTLLEYAGHPKSIKEFTIRIERIGLSDGTIWSGGKILKRDPNNPNNWKVNQNSKNFEKSQPLNFSLFNSINFFKSAAFLSTKSSKPSRNETACVGYLGDANLQCNNYALPRD